jgi:hypothetical protein
MYGFLSSAQERNQPANTATIEGQQAAPRSGLVYALLRR